MLVTLLCVPYVPFVPSLPLRGFLPLLSFLPLRDFWKIMEVRPLVPLVQPCVFAIACVGDAPKAVVRDLVAVADEGIRSGGAFANLVLGKAFA
jgi:hypothetical protein